MVVGVWPTWQRYEERAWFVLAGPLEAYAWLCRGSQWAIVVFPLLASACCVPAFATLLANRYVAYTRVRQSVRVLLGRSLLRTAWVTFATFCAIGAVPQLFVSWGVFSFDPAASGLADPAAVFEAERSSLPYGQLLPWGAWAPALAYAAFLGANAACYALLTQCCVAVVGRRLVGYSLPWMIYLAVSFVMAVAWLEAYSPALAFPFGLEQLPLANSLLVVGVLVATVGVCVSGVLVAAPRLDGFR